MSDLVSVIIPTHGPPVHLESAILSVVSQSYDNIEIIIVDDNGHSSFYRSMASRPLLASGHARKSME